VSKVFNCLDLLDQKAFKSFITFIIEDIAKIYTRSQTFDAQMEEYDTFIQSFVIEPFTKAVKKVKFMNHLGPILTALNKVSNKQRRLEKRDESKAILPSQVGGLFLEQEV